NLSGQLAPESPAGRFGVCGKNREQAICATGSRQSDHSYPGGGCNMNLNRRQVLRAGAGALLAPLAFWAPRSRAQNGGPPYGIDVSHWQGSVDWDTVVANGYTFAFCKATENTGYRDPSFPTNFSELARVGMYRGCYHFARPSTSPSISSSAIAQANH